MNATTDFIYTPTEIEAVLGLKADIIRDWRRRAILNEFGEQDEHRRWKYSLRDLVGFAVAELFSKRGEPLGRAADIGYWSALQFIECIQKPEKKFRAKVGIHFKHDPENPYSSEIEWSSSLERLARDIERKIDIETGVFIYVDRLISELPHKVVKEIKRSKENEGERQ